MMLGLFLAIHIFAHRNRILFVKKQEIDTLYLYETLRHEVKGVFEELVQRLEREWSKKKELHSIIITTVITGLAVNMVSSVIIDYIEKRNINLITTITASIILITSIAIWYYVIRHYSITYRPQVTYVCILSRLRDKSIMKILGRLREKSLVIKSEEITDHVYEVLKIFHSNAVDEIRLEVSSNEMLLDTSREMKYIRMHYYGSLAELSVKVYPLPILALKDNTLFIVCTHDVEIIFTIHLSEEKLRGKVSYDVLKSIMHQTQLLVYSIVEIILDYLNTRSNQT